jgi:hypothetical protein
MKRVLLKIANTLVLQSYCLENNGLIDGKMGLVLFFYHYARISGYKQYREFADTLFDKIIKDIANTSNDFEKGLIGIGWATNSLIKNGFIEGNHELFIDVDNRVFSHILINKYSIFGYGLYLLMRLENNLHNADYLRKQVDKIIFSWYDQLKKTDIVVPLYHLNSILHFINQVYDKGYIKKSHQQIRQLLEKLFENTFVNNYYNNTDLLVFREIMNNIHNKSKKEWIILSRFIDREASTSQNISIEEFIKKTWLNIIYFKKTSLTLPRAESISAFIDLKQRNLTWNDFTLNEGLAGLGYSLIMNNTNNKR